MPGSYLPGAVGVSSGHITSKTLVEVLAAYSLVLVLAASVLHTLRQWDRGEREIEIQPHLCWKGISSGDEFQRTAMRGMAGWLTPDS